MKIKFNVIFFLRRKKRALIDKEESVGRLLFYSEKSFMFFLIRIGSLFHFFKKVKSNFRGSLFILFVFVYLKYQRILLFIKYVILMHGLFAKFDFTIINLIFLVNVLSRIEGLP
jgi:hypothetical protein